MKQTALYHTRTWAPHGSKFAQNLSLVFVVFILHNPAILDLFLTSETRLSF